MPFQIEPVQKPLAPPDDVVRYLDKTDPSHAILERVFFVGTELYNIKTIDDYAWIYPKLSDEIINTNLLSSGFVYFFGQTEPMVSEGQQIMVPVLICVKSSRELPFELSITSVQAQDEEIVDLNRLMLHFMEQTVYESRQSGRGNRPTVSLSCEILELAGRISAIPKKNQNSYTYSNVYLPFPAYLERQLAEHKESDSCDVNLQCEGKNVTACIAKGDNLTKQAKFVYLKYVEERNMENVNVDKTEVDNKIINGIVATFETSIKQDAEAFKEKKKQLQHRVDDAKKNANVLKGIEVTKYYPIDADGDIYIKTSKFVNRYFGNANKVVQ